MNDYEWLSSHLASRSPSAVAFYEGEAFDPTTGRALSPEDLEYLLEEAGREDSQHAHDVLSGAVRAGALALRTAHPSRRSALVSMLADARALLGALSPDEWGGHPEHGPSAEASKLAADLDALAAPIDSAAPRARAVRLLAVLTARELADRLAAGIAALRPLPGGAAAWSWSPRTREGHAAPPRIVLAGAIDTLGPPPARRVPAVA